MKKNYTKRIEEANLEDIYVSDKKGKREGYFIPLNEMRVMKQALAMIKKHEGYFDALAVKGSAVLNEMGLPIPSKAIPGQIHKIIDNVTLLVDTKEYVAMEMVEGILSKTCKVMAITDKEIPQDALKGYTKFEDDEFVVDETKKQEYLNTLG